MKNTVYRLMLTISLLLPFQAFAGDSATLANAKIEAKIFAARVVADAAANNADSPETRQAAIEAIKELTNGLNLSEQEMLLEEVIQQTMETSTWSIARANGKLESAGQGAFIVALGVVVAIVAAKTGSGSISKYAAGAAIGSGLSAIYNLYVANGLAANTSEHVREMQEAMIELHEQLRLRIKADSI
jgi:hypothetical protein